MDYKEAKILTDKFFEGNTSLKEEHVLKDYFNSSKNIPSDLFYAKELFCQNEKEANETVDEFKFHRTKRFSARSVIAFSGIAASIILLFGIMFFTLDKNNETVYAYYNGMPITDENQALEETYKAINLISKNLNRGTADLNYLNKFNRIETLIKK